jgi:hypothetical protein
MMIGMKPWLLGAMLFSTLCAEEFNYDETKVSPYVLPLLFEHKDGTPAMSASLWQQQRRAEIVSLLEKEMFGKAPPRPALRFRVMEAATPALGGKALRQQVRVFFSSKDDPALDLLVYRPAQHSKPAPVIFGLNFKGNQSVQADPAILLCRSWIDNKDLKKPDVHHALEESRGIDAGKWPMAYAIERGYAVVTGYYGDIDPDVDDGWKNGVHALFPENESQRNAESWGSLAAWAWGMSVAMDWIVQEPSLDGKRVALQGFSRLGKATLWAAACDERFAAVISQNSGAGGAALNKRIFGETVGRLNRSFPHWFCGNFRQHSDNEAAMPFDSHFLLALAAPRPLLITSATEDRWADPHGEFLAARATNPVYQLFSHTGLTATEMPAPGKLVNDRIGYFLRQGPHSVTEEDWKAYCDFCDRHMPFNP